MDLPIAYREMRVIARSPGIYRGRLISSIVLLVIGIGFAILYHYFGIAGALPLIGVLSFVIFQICLFSGAQATADSLSSEKREGTIGLLFLTHLKAYEITIGKLIANGLVVFYGLFISLPLLSLGMIVGGITIGALAQIAISALNILFVSASIGLFASSHCIERKKASALAVYIVLFFWFGLPAISAGLTALNAPQWLLTALSLFSFGASMKVAVSTPFTFVLGVGGGNASPWMSLLTMHLLGWLFLGLATRSLRKNWQEHPPRKKFRLRERWAQITYGKGEKRSRHRRALLNKNAFYWLASRNRLAPLGLWITTLFVMVFPGAIWASSMGLPGGAIVIVLGFSILYKIIVGANAGHRLGIESEQGTLEMILSTPIAEKEIIRGQFMATWRACRGPVILVFILQICFIVALVVGPALGLLSTSPAWALAMLGFSVVYVLDLWTMVWLGMWSVTIVREAKKASGVAIARCMVIPGLIFGFLASAWSLTTYLLGLNLRPPVWLIFAVWFLLGLVNDIFWITFIRRNLPVQLRRFSMRRYSQTEQISDISRIVVWILNAIFRRKQPPRVRPAAVMQQN